MANLWLSNPWRWGWGWRCRWEARASHTIGTTGWGMASCQLVVVIQRAACGQFTPKGRGRAKKDREAVKGRDAKPFTAAKESPRGLPRARSCSTCPWLGCWVLVLPYRGCNRQRRKDVLTVTGRVSSRGGKGGVPGVLPSCNQLASCLWGSFTGSLVNEKNTL